MSNRFIVRDGIGGSAGETDRINAAAEVLDMDVEDLTNVTLWVRQITDAGTATLDIQISPDGTTFRAFGAALTEASFPAGANTLAATISVSDANGMPLAIKTVRVSGGALAGGGAYGAKVSGFQRAGYR